MKLSNAEIDAIIAASPRTTVPFNKLVLSETCQARPSDSKSRLSIAELAASIKDSGVLQNLVVIKGARGGLHEVCAGGRRLDALALLVQNADIAENYPVPVLVVPADQALLASLAENVFHEPMHPADEYIDFAKLSAQGKSVEDVAAAFGVTPLVVKRRMKLATVSPRLMAKFRDDQIGLDCLMVLASVDEHAKQEQVWANLPSWNRRADCLRQMLTQGEIESDRDPVARCDPRRLREGRRRAAPRPVLRRPQEGLPAGCSPAGQVGLREAPTKSQADRRAGGLEGHGAGVAR